MFFVGCTSHYGRIERNGLQAVCLWPIFCKKKRLICISVRIYLYFCGEKLQHSCESTELRIYGSTEMPCGGNTLSVELWIHEITELEIYG